MRRMWLLMLVVVAVVGCDRGGDVTPEQTVAPTLGPTRTEEGVPGPLKPRASSSKQIDPTNQVGQEMFITDEEFVPKQLFAVFGATIRFVNETDDDVSVKFTNIESDPIRIAPDDFVDWKPPHGGSVVIVTDDPDRRAAIQVDAYYEPGETADPERQD